MIPTYGVLSESADVGDFVVVRASCVMTKGAAALSAWGVCGKRVGVALA